MDGGFHNLCLVGQSRQPDHGFDDVCIVRQLLPGSRFRMYYGAVIVIAANAGGCLTVIGDVSTLMLWVKGAVTPSSFSGAMFLPSIVAVAIPTYLISRKLPEQMDINTPRIRYRGMIRL